MSLADRVLHIRIPLRDVSSRIYTQPLRHTSDDALLGQIIKLSSGLPVGDFLEGSDWTLEPVEGLPHELPLAVTEIRDILRETMREETSRPTNLTAQLTESTVRQLAAEQRTLKERVARLEDIVAHDVQWKIENRP